MTATPKNRPTLRSTGEELYCEDCKPAGAMKISDLQNASPCPCGATWSDKTPKGARYVVRAR